MKRVLLGCCLWLGSVVAPPAAAVPTDLDPAFGGTGERADPFVTAGLVTRFDGRAIAVSAAGRTYVVGGANGGATVEDAVIGVLEANGSIASSINGSGIALLGQARFEDLVLLPDGAVLACGLRYTSQTEHRWLVARFTPNLNLDPSFGNGGVVVGELAPRSVCHAIDWLSDGRVAIVGAGYVGADGEPGFLAVLDEQGVPDRGFAGSGVVQLAFGPDSPAGADLAEGLDGSLWLSAGSWSAGLGLRANVIQRFRSNGERLSARFGNVNAFSPRPASSGRFAIDPFGEVLIGEQSDVFRQTWTELYLYYSRRSPTDALVNEGFLFEFGQNPINGNGYQFGDLALLPDGRQMVAGTYIEEAGGASRARLAVQRILANVSGADFSFATTNGGFLHRPAGQPDGVVDPFPIARGVAVGRDGRITVLSRRSSGQSGMTLTRFVGDGINDATIDLNPDPSGLQPGSRVVGPNAQASSDLMGVFGLAANARVPLTVVGGEYQLNAGAWSTHPTLVRNGDWVRLRGRAPGTGGNSRTVSMAIGGLRAKNSWDAIGARQQVNFVISAQSSIGLPGTRCSQVAGATNCTAAIPDGSGSVTSVLPLEYVVPGQCNFIKTVHVGLELSHPYVGDLRVILQDPNFDAFGGAGNVTLLDRTRNGVAGASGSCDADNIAALFRDDAPIGPDESCGLIPNQPALSADIAPVQSLGSLLGRRGTNANGASTLGTWQLVVRDLANGDVGQLNDWSVDVECSSTPVFGAEVSVMVTGATTGIAGTPVTFGWQVRNNGPDNSGLVRFNAPLPLGAATGYTEVSWSCTGSAGATCSYPVFCGPLSCNSSTVSSDLSLPAGATVDLSVTAIIGAALAPGDMPATTATAVLANLDTTDPDTQNNSATHVLSPQFFADLRADGLSAAVVGGNQIEISASFSNGGPSFAPSTTTTLTLPGGYSFVQASCERSGVACGGTTFLNGQQIVLDTLPLVGNGAANVWTIRAAYAGATPPTGQITLTTALPGGIGVGEPNLGNNSRTINTPTGTPPDALFQDGFETP
ncbi:MAG: hypothetical protein KDI56_11135 [Xanthomonadales bacterium]|nr:hypothetical protein [Xanthomonadales bacterium]